MTGIRRSAVFALKSLLKLAPDSRGPRVSRFFLPHDRQRVAVAVPRSDVRQRSTLHRHRKPRFSEAA